MDLIIIQTMVVYLVQKIIFIKLLIMRSLIRIYLKKFKHNMNGYNMFYKFEINAKPLFVVTILYFILGFYLQYSYLDWAIVLTSFSLVWIAELLNTGVEKSVDLVSKEYSELAKAAKDISGAAVILAIVNAIVVSILLNLAK